MIFGCKHKWEIIETIKYKSLVEEISSVALKVNFSAPAYNWAQRTVITIVQCSKCFEVKHITTIV